MVAFRAAFTCLREKGFQKHVNTKYHKLANIPKSHLFAVMFLSLKIIQFASTSLQLQFWSLKIMEIQWQSLSGNPSSLSTTRNAPLPPSETAKITWWPRCAMVRPMLTIGRAWPILSSCGPKGRVLGVGEVLAPRHPTPWWISGS